MLPRDVDVAILTSASELEALCGEWHALWARARDATTFESPHWLLPWWTHLGCGELLVVTLRRAGALVGVAPFYVYTDAASGRRTLYFMGAGVSDYADALLHDDVPGGADAIVSALAECDERWDAADLMQLRPTSPMLHVGMRGTLHAACRPGDVCPVVPLPSTVDGLEHVIPRGALKKWHYRRRRIEREGSVTYERATSDTLDELLDALFTLHGERWSTREMPGVLADGSVQAFHRDVAHALLEEDALRLYALRFDGRVSAVIYGFAHRGRTCFYIGGFDPADALLSPGSVIIGHAIEEAIREGCTAFDFLRGSEAYKYRWGAIDTPTWCRTLTHVARPAESVR